MVLLVELRHVDGIILSSLRGWSSFSAVPAIFSDVPILGIQSDNKYGLLPHVHQCTSEQYHGLKEVAPFVERMVRVRNYSCSFIEPGDPLS